MVKRKRNVIIAVFCATAIAVSPIGGGTALAADETQTVTVSADSENGDQNKEYGDISSSSEDALQVYAFNGKSATVTTGSLTTTDDDGAQFEAYGDGSSIKATINGDIEAYDTGFWTESYDKSSIDITVNGDISSDGDDGISLYSEGSSVQNITVNGNVTSDEEAIYSYSYDDSEVNITIKGNLQSDYNEAIDAETYGKSIMNIDVSGNLDTNSDDIIYAWADDNSTLNINVNGNMTSTQNDGIVVGTYENGTLNITATGNVKAYSEAAYLFASENAQTNFMLDGNISGRDYGLFLDNIDEGVINVLVTDTVSSDDCPVVIDDGSNIENISLTVWRIIPDENGAVACSPTGVDGTNVEYEEFEKQIMYIIKVNQPNGGTISATKADGSALLKSRDYDVALEGEKVLLKPSTGYKISSAYNTVDGSKLNLSQDADGNYYVIVPKGGAVLLSAELVKEKYEISFYNEDGTILFTKTVDYGDYITIPDLPTLNGYKSLYWQGSIYYPGDKYQVTGPHTFKAIYEKIEEESSDKEEDASDASTDTAASVVNSVTRTTASPATGDNSMVVFMILLMILSSAGAASICACKCKINR